MLVGDLICSDIYSIKFWGHEASVNGDVVRFTAKQQLAYITQTLKQYNDVHALFFNNICSRTETLDTM